MKTWEMMQHSGKKFKRKSDGFVIEIAPDGTLYWDSGHRFLNTNDEWEEVKEPVDFMTVIAEVKHAQRRLPITLIYEKYEAKYRNEYLSNVLNYLRMNFESNKIAEIIQNGKWYIED